MARTLPDQTASAPLPTKPLALANVASLAGGATPEASLMARMRSTQSGPGYAAGGMVKPTYFGDRPPPPATPPLHDTAPTRPIPPRGPALPKPVGGLPGGASHLIQPAPEYPQERVRPAEPAPTPVGTYIGLPGVVDALRNRKVKNAEAADYACGGTVKKRGMAGGGLITPVNLGQGLYQAIAQPIAEDWRQGNAAIKKIRDEYPVADSLAGLHPLIAAAQVANDVSAGNVGGDTVMNIAQAVPVVKGLSGISKTLTKQAGPTIGATKFVIDMPKTVRKNVALTAGQTLGQPANSFAAGGMVRFAGKGGPRDDQIPVKVAGAEINVSDGENAVILPAKTAANPAAIQAIEGIIQATNDGRQPKAGIEAGGEYQVGSYPYDGKRPPTAQEVYGTGFRATPLATSAVPGSVGGRMSSSGVDPRDIPAGGTITNLSSPLRAVGQVFADSAQAQREGVSYQDVLAQRANAQLAQQSAPSQARAIDNAMPAFIVPTPAAPAPAPAAPALEVPEPAGDRGMPPVEPRSLGTFTYKGKTVNVPEEGPTGVPRMDSAPVGGPQIMSISPGGGGGMPPARGPVDTYGNSTALTSQLKGQLADVTATKQAEQAQSDKLTAQSMAMQKEVSDRQQAERDKWEREVDKSSIMNPQSGRARTALEGIYQQAEAEAARNRGMFRGQDVQERIAGQKSESDMRQAQLRAQTDLGTTGMRVAGDARNTDARVGGELEATGMRTTSAERMNTETVSERKAAAAAHDTALKEIARANREGTEPKAYEVKNAAGQTTHLVQFVRDAGGQWQPRRIPVMDQPKA